MIQEEERLSGGPVDVTWHEGIPVMVWQRKNGESSVLIEQRGRGYRTWPLGTDVGAFPRVLSWKGALWTIYREGASRGGNAVLLKDGVEIWRSAGECGGNDPVALGPGHFAWQRSGDNKVYVGNLEAPEDMWVERSGAPTGISHLEKSGTVILVDEVRGSISGMTRPCWAGALIAGEHPVGGVLLKHSSGWSSLLWKGEITFTPRIAYDEASQQYALVTWDPTGVRRATFQEQDLPKLEMPKEEWLPSGASINVGSFFDISGSTVPREASDGQCWQVHRSGEELLIVKGGMPHLVEVLRITPDAIRLAYDATDGRYPRAWRLDVTGDGRSDALWAPVIQNLGWSMTFPAAELIRRSVSGPSTREFFPYRVGLERAGKHIDYGGDLGQVDGVVVTSYTPQVGRSGDDYTEHHHWAQKGGRPIGLVRYEEFRSGKLARSFTFNRYAPQRDTPLSRLIVHPIPDAPSAPHEDTPMPGWTYNDKDAVEIIRFLERKYLFPPEKGGMGRESVDHLGYARWLHDAIRLLDAGKSLSEALREINRRINAIVGLPTEVWPEAEDEDTPPPPPPPPQDALPPLRIKDGKWAQDIREVGGFTLYDQWLQYGPEVMGYYPRQVAALGANMIRVLLGMGKDSYWMDRTQDGRKVTAPELDDAYYARLPEFVTWLESYGLYTRVCFLGSLAFGGPIPDRRDHYTAGVREWALAHVRRVATALKPVSHLCLAEVANEYNQIGFGSNVGAIVELGERIKHSAPTLLLCGSQGNGPNADSPVFFDAVFDYADAHLDRRRGFGGFEWVKRSSESPVVDGRLPFISGEPINFGPPAPGRREGDDNERSPAVALAYAGTARMKGYVTNFHCEAALNCAPFDEATLRCAMSWMEGLRRIPFQSRPQWVNGHWNESPWGTENFPSRDDDESSWPRVIRIFGRADGYWVSIGQRLGWSARTKEGRTVSTLQATSHGDYQCRIWKE